MTAGPSRRTYGTTCNCRKPCCFFPGAARGQHAGLDRFELAGTSDAARADPAIWARCAGKTASWPQHSLAAVATT